MSWVAVPFAVCFLLQAPPARPADGGRPATEPPPSQADVQKILDAVKQKAASDAKADQAKGNDWQEKAERAFAENRLADAVRFIRQAQKFDPESATLRRLARHYEKKQEEAGERAANLNVARTRLDEALMLARRLRATEPAAARAYAQAVLDGAARFPAEFDLAEQKEAARALLLGEEPPPLPGQAEAARGADAQPPVPVAPPLPPPAPAPPGVNVKTALKTRLTVSWLQVPLTQALADLADHTGVTFIIDPALARLRWFETRAITYEGKDVPADKLLREIMEVALMESVPGRNGQVLLTTKRQALAFAVGMGQDQAEGAIRRPLPPLPPPPRGAVAPRQEMPLPPEKPTAMPDHLRTPQAFLKSLDEWLGPAPAPGDKPVPLPPE